MICSGVEERKIMGQLKRASVSTFVGKWACRIFVILITRPSVGSRAADIKGKIS